MNHFISDIERRTRDQTLLMRPHHEVLFPNRLEKNYKKNVVIEGPIPGQVNAVLEKKNDVKLSSFLPNRQSEREIKTSKKFESEMKVRSGPEPTKIKPVLETEKALSEDSSDQEAAAGQNLGSGDRVFFANPNILVQSNKEIIKEKVAYDTPDLPAQVENYSSLNVNDDLKGEESKDSHEENFVNQAAPKMLSSEVVETNLEDAVPVKEIKESQEETTKEVIQNVSIEQPIYDANDRQPPSKQSDFEILEGVKEGSRKIMAFAKACANKVKNIYANVEDQIFTWAGKTLEAIEKNFLTGKGMKAIDEFEYQDNKDVEASKTLEVVKSEEEVEIRFQDVNLVEEGEFHEETNKEEIQNVSIKQLVRKYNAKGGPLPSKQYNFEILEGVKEGGRKTVESVYSKCTAFAKSFAAKAKNISAKAVDKIYAQIYNFFTYESEDSQDEDVADDNAYDHTPMVLVGNIHDEETNKEEIQNISIKQPVYNAYEGPLSSKQYNFEILEGPQEGSRKTEKSAYSKITGFVKACANKAENIFEKGVDQIFTQIPTRISNLFTNESADNLVFKDEHWNVDFGGNSHDTD